ncbi:hypothetical protein FISHEDRAFT_76018 [Fistulina hepatica ATCC 64428]|uniref:Methyltransferase domain-containing protein n=1 Tax=Fistulina hepatica ATCC 64428 TaxID=1128425 RepID=A0A0D7A569_9AGAR|nr:hypothetical protein FISHEDRAFT_76018 [Fistulina hepatica ATCC 64428]
MPGAYRFHPRYAVVVFVVIVVTMYFLGPYQREDFYPQHFPRPSLGEGWIVDNNLPVRLARSDRIYKKMLNERKRLIQKFGPNPKDIAMFPPDKDPWPAYTVWDYFPPAYNCPHEVERIGALGDGGKWVCGLSRIQTKKDCVIYSVGINYESSFEADILENTEHCEVWGYDWKVRGFGPQIPKHLLKRTHFHQFGLAGSDKQKEGDESPMYTLDTLMRRNGHTHIDILRVDIESLEFDVMNSLIKSYLATGAHSPDSNDSSDTHQPLPFGQLLMEIHVWGKKFPEFLAWWELLEEAGLRPFWTEPNLVYQNYNKQSNSDLAEYSFLNIKGENAFIKDRAPSQALHPQDSNERIQIHAPDRD